MLNIDIKTIPRKDQRYETVGDYYESTADDGLQHVRVSDMGNSDYELLVAIHELVEWYLTAKRGIKPEDIDDFDIKFEALRSTAPEVIGDQEPGHMVSAPYHKEHVTAERIERILAAELGVDWEAYNTKANHL